MFVSVSLETKPRLDLKRTPVYFFYILKGFMHEGIPQFYRNPWGTKRIQLSLHTRCYMPEVSISHGETRCGLILEILLDLICRLSV